MSESPKISGAKTPPPSVGWTCPNIDRLLRHLDKHLPDEQQAHARWLLEKVRTDNAAMRERLAWFEEKA